MTILSQLIEDMKASMKAQDSVRLSAIRMLISAIKYAMVDNPDLDEVGVVAILSKEAKKRRESALAYRSGGREELAKGEEFELELIAKYLPTMLTEDQVRDELLKVKDQLVTAGNIGAAMKIALPLMQGKADGGVVSKIVKDILQS